MPLANQGQLKELDLDASDPQCIILASCDGAAAEWNAHNSPQIYAFDRILQMNDEACTGQNLIKLLRSEEQTLQLRLQRPSKRLLYLKKPGQLGIDLTYADVTGPWKSSVRPWITCIKEDGLVAEWNQKMPELNVACRLESLRRGSLKAADDVVLPTCN